MSIWLAVFLGGGLGSLARYGITRGLLALDLRGAFPWATLASNALASVLLAWLLLRWAPGGTGRPAMAAFATIGFCGGFSTFSTFSYENFLLMRQGLFGMAAANIAVSLVVCIGVFFLLSRGS